jgi:NitT/TauT family transport system ATP-binding protein
VSTSRETGTATGTAPSSDGSALHAPGPVIVEAESVTKTFTTPDGRALPVLDGISFALREGEIVALLGKSGSGKSTLLRCIAGLIAPSSGTVAYRGTPLNGANPGVAMVFQSFALLPWLTVQQNVELAMQARDVPEAQRAERALRAIDLIGLDGFESAYPKELSGGMRQRVGFARALVVEPDALLMDEPFSALDVLTAANLRGELTRLWEGREFPVKSVLIVTHNIEEAVQLADRILVLSSNPGRIRSELEVNLPRPRDRRDPRFDAIVDTVYGILTGREEKAHAAVEEAAEPTGTQPGAGAPAAATPAEMPLPEVSAGGLSGLLEILVVRGGEDGLAELAEDFNFEIDDLLPLVDAAVMLGMAIVADARIRITDEGRAFAAADIDTGKHLFAQAAADRAPLIRAIVKALRATADGTLREGFFLDLLRRGFSADEARHQLGIAIDWGRYAELFEYDAERGELVLGVANQPAPVA